MSDLVYKIAASAAWDAAVNSGRFVGSVDDLRDGFIHFSSAHQLEATAAKYFTGRTDLVLVAVSADSLGPDLRYEPSRDGQLFPHLYAALLLSAVVWTAPLPWRDGAFVWPSKLG